MTSFLKNLKAVEVAGAINCLIGAGLNMLALYTGDTWGIVAGSIMITNGVILTHLR